MDDNAALSSYEKNTKEQYEALGRFVEAFEAMVDEVRESTITLIERDRKHSRLVAIALHHSTLTAKPLYETFRAVVMEIVDDAITMQNDKEKGVDHLDPPLLVDILDDPLVFTPAERDIFRGVLKTIIEEYDDLISARNNLLHGTWFIGFSSSDDPSCSEFYVRKLKTTKDGLSCLSLPQNAAQLHELSNRCEATRTWIAWLHSCLVGPDKIAERFELRREGRLLIWPNGDKTPLPRK